MTWVWRRWCHIDGLEGGRLVKGFRKSHGHGGNRIVAEIRMAWMSLHIRWGIEASKMMSIADLGVMNRIIGVSEIIKLSWLSVLKIMVVLPTGTRMIKVQDSF